jgi:hypothetical protein
MPGMRPKRATKGPIIQLPCGETNAFSAGAKEKTSAIFYHWLAPMLLIQPNPS